MTDEKETPPQETPALARSFQSLDDRDRLILYGTGAAFLLGFLPWYSVSAFGVSQSISGFSPWHGKIYFLSCVAIAALLLFPDLRAQILDKLSPAARSLTIPVLGAVTFIFGPVFFMLDSRQAFAGSEETEGMLSAGRTFWFLLALIASGGVAVIAGMKWKKAAAA